MTTNDKELNEMQVVVQEFLDESRQYAETLNKDLLNIEDMLKQGENLPEDLLNDIFRAAHTIKGTSSFLGFNNIFKLMHGMETILDEIRKGERKFDSNIIDLTFESFDTLDTLLKQLETEGNDDGNVTDILNKLNALQGETASTKTSEKPAETKKEAAPTTETTEESKEDIEEQLVNETLGDDFLFSNAIMKTFELLDEMDILKQKNNKSNVYEAYIKRNKIKDAIGTIKEFGNILRYYKFSEGGDAATKIKDETDIDKNTSGIFLLLTGKNDIDSVEDDKNFSIREVYHYKESILFSMPPKEKDKFLKEFIDNTEVQMEEFSHAMIKLEEDITNEELINAAFRSMHTIKGSAGFIGISSFETTAHKIENIMSKVRDKEIQVSEALVTLLLEGLDALSITLAAFKKDPHSPSNLLGIQNRLDSFLKEEKDVKKTAAKKNKKTKKQAGETHLDIDSLSATEVSELKEYLGKFDNLYELTYIIEKNTPIKSMKASLIETKLEKEGAVIKSVPIIDDIPDDKKEETIKILYITSNDSKTIHNQINIDKVYDIKINKINTANLFSEAVEEAPVEKEETVKKVAPTEKPKEQDMKQPATPSKAPPPPPASKPITTTTVRVDIDKLDSLMNLAGELVITKARFSQLVNNMKLLIEKNNIYSMYIDSVNSMFNEIDKSTKILRASNSNGNLKKEYGKLDKLFNSISEQILKLDVKVSNKNQQNKLLELEENTLKLGKISSDLQNGIMQTRMVPVENVFSRFRRVVRDLSKSLKKDVILEIFGEDTELDKKIIDELADPLTHMIRNALDHGIESKKERLEKGKSETGTVTLSAYHKGNHICIEVSDDGSGIDADALLQSSVKKGILTEKAGEELSYKEKLDLIFSPGFSMAKEVTGVSGRGVGMDVVKKMIESINGSVDIETVIDEETKFVLNIPLTLAIIQALLIVISDEVYAIPLESVIEIIKIKTEDIYHIDGGETIKLRGHALSIIDLRDTIKLKESDAERQSHKTIVVVTNGEEQLGIVLDSLIGEQEIVIKSLTEHFSNVKGIVGASVLGDGTISLILDIQAIIKLAA